MDTQSKIIVAAVAGLVVGFFVGREQLKYQIASAMADSARALTSVFAKNPLAVASGASSAATSASESKKETGKENAANYADKLTIYDFTASFHQSYEGKVPGVEFKIKNGGEKTVTELKVTVYFQDATGATIAEEDFYPVLANSFSIANKTPLKPGYVWQQERNKFYAAKQVPSEWKEGAAKIAVSEVEFE